jgi:RND family efflux transporter MFP subunit
MTRRFVQVVIPLLILATALYAAREMAQHKSSVPTGTPPQTQQRVEVYNPVPWDQPFVIHALGKTIPARELTLQAQVSGLISKLHPELVPGGRVHTGDTLVEIEKSDYLLKIKQAQSQVEQARVRVKEEKGRRNIAAREWALLGRGKGDKNVRGRTLALREPQLKSAKSALKAAKSVLAGANLALERTAIRAPMNAVVLRENIEVGQRLAPGAGIVTLAGTDQWWVQVSLSQVVQTQLQANTVSVTVHASNDRVGISARLVRQLADLDDTGKMVRLIIEVDDPLRLSTKGSPLYLRDTVDVQFRCRPKIKGLLALPRKALRPNDVVWTISTDGTLQIQPVNVFWKGEGIFLVEGLGSDTLVVSSNLNMPTPETRLQWDTPKRLKPSKKTESL